jgi:hypothetical protein
LGERAKVIAAVAAGLGAHAPAGLPGKRLERLRCNARALPFYRALGPLSVSVGLIADSLQLGNTVLQQRVGKIGDAILDGVVEPLELGVDFGRALATRCDILRTMANR